MNLIRSIRPFATVSLALFGMSLPALAGDPELPSRSTSDQQCERPLQEAIGIGLLRIRPGMIEDDLSRVFPLSRLSLTFQATNLLVTQGGTVSTPTGKIREFSIPTCPDKILRINLDYANGRFVARRAEIIDLKDSLSHGSSVYRG